MDKETLEKFYWPITVDPYDEEYYDKMLDAINGSFNSQPFNWYIGCMKGFVFNYLEQDIKDSLINSFGEANPDFCIIENEAHLMVLSQAIIYNIIFNGEDKILSSKLSLALNTMMFCYNSSIYRLPNVYFVNEMQSFFRSRFIEMVEKIKVDFAKVDLVALKEKSIIELDVINQAIPAIFQRMNSLILYNEIMYWLINRKSLKRKIDYKELSKVDAAFNIGLDLGEMARSEPLVYPEAYLTKLIFDMGQEKSFFDVRESLEDIIKESSIDFLDEKYNNSVLYPLCFTLMHNLDNKDEITPLMDLSSKITLFDFAVQVYYESILTNLLN